MKYFLFTIFILSAAAAIAGRPNTSAVTRIEGHYTVRYECRNENTYLDAEAAGTVVYYLTPRHIGADKVEFKLYADSVTGTWNGEPVREDNYAIALLNALWPLPPASAAGDSVSVAEHAVAVTLDMAARIGKDEEKLLRLTGSGFDIKEWTITCNYVGGDTTCIRPESLLSMEQDLEIEGKGVNFRRVFHAPSTKCVVRTVITGCSATEITAGQAKEEKKGRKKR